MRKDDPIVGWPEWLVTACFYAIVIAYLYVQFFMPLSAASSVDDGQAARSCGCMEVTP